MKSHKITYWITTGLISLVMTFTSYVYLSKAPQIMDELKKAGMPYYIFAFLGVIKLVGIVALLFSKCTLIKEWTYAGFTFLLVGAIWLHLATNTQPTMAIISLTVLFLMHAGKG